MTSRFLTDLHLGISADGEHKRLDAPLVYESEVAGRIFIVPTGFETDLASVPRLPVAYLLFGGVGDAAAVVHDYLYTTQEVSRKVADDVLAEAMKVSGISAWRRGPMWIGVRMFGWLHYNKPADVPA
ncbi:DUF1353 domain-containing protein [Noviherbaspirillum sp. Root189]|uniref:DUF1353 domain-containing protein n=1 Tax=Noviherbaspirillum sp. Root189 TaxID=1736487 RepID=UPI000709A053|nr:DUF1353 domain-containing protein [Noviherbaspirillum sp. Root189]KRB73434.1 hypothetical protein ASE07_06170 [Noviherbaspirillum sp. Root189]